MAIFNSYVKLPEGKLWDNYLSTGAGFPPSTVGFPLLRPARSAACFQRPRRQMVQHDAQPRETGLQLLLGLAERGPAMFQRFNQQQ